MSATWMAYPVLTAPVLPSPPEASACPKAARRTGAASAPCRGSATPRTRLRAGACASTASTLMKAPCGSFGRAGGRRRGLPDSRSACSRPGAHSGWRSATRRRRTPWGEASRCRSSAKDNLSRPLPLHQAETVDCLARHLVGVLSPDLLASVRVFLIPGRPDEVLQTDIAERMLPPVSSGAQVQLYLSVPTSRATDSSWTATSHSQKLPVKGLGAVEFGHGHDGRCQLQRMPSALTGMNPVIWNGLPGLARLSAGASTVWPASSTMKW